MIPDIRADFNLQFTKKKYQHFLNTISSSFDYTPPFRIAETPVFIPKSLERKLLKACDGIISSILRDDFKTLTAGSLKNVINVPNEDDQPLFMALDFGICLDENGGLTPQLIELQGFPSLYHFQELLASSYRKSFDLNEKFQTHPGDLTREQYLHKLKDAILDGEDPKHVILLEIEPEKQATRIDFLCVEKELGVPTVCISEVIKDGKNLYYQNASERTQIKRIYNRVIFDELNQREDLKRSFNFDDDLNVIWVGHPNWFFRVSKFALPLLKGAFVPECYYLSELDSYPSDLENYVLKPLYSFAGYGVQLDIDAEILDSIEDRENYILQKKVTYAPVLHTPGEGAKLEVRMMTLHDNKENRTSVINNLVRITKGKMVGVKYNKNKEWVGASVGFFER